MKVKIINGFYSLKEKRNIKADEVIDVSEEELEILIAKNITKRNELIKKEGSDIDEKDIDEILVKDYKVVINGSWYAFPDGKKLQGRDAAIKYSESLGELDEDDSTDETGE